VFWLYLGVVLFSSLLPGIPRGRGVMVPRFWSILSMLMLLILMVQSSLAKEEVFEEIIARVNNDIITKSDYEKSRDLIRRELQRNLKGEDLDKAVTKQEKDLLKTLIEDQLLVQKAADLSLTADTEVVKYLDRIRRDQNISDMETLEKMMLQQGIDPTEFKQNVKNQSLKQQVLGHEVFSRLQISTEEINKYYESHLQEFDRPEQVRIREILISTEGKDATQIAALEKKAQEALQKAKSGEKFDELAIKYSDGSTAKEGGDLGFFPRGKMVKEVEDAAFSLRRGQVSDIIKTKYGFQIIKVEEKHAAGIQKIEVVMNDIRDQIFSTKAQPAIAEYLVKLRKQSYIEVKPGYSDSGAVASTIAVAENKESVENSTDQGKKGKKKKK